MNNLSFIVGKLILLKITLFILLISGLVFFVRNYKSFLKFKELDVEKQLKENNTAVAIVVASIFIAFALIIIAIMSGTAYGDTVCSNLQINKNIYMPPNAKIVGRKNIGGICQITVKIKNYIGQDQYLPVYAAKNFVLIGTMFKNRVNITDNAITVLKERQLKESVKQARPYLKYYFAKYAPAKPNGKILYVFVDPLCPFCHEIEPYLKGLADKSGYSIQMYFTIVHGKPAYNDAMGFICSKGSYSRYIKDAKSLKYGDETCVDGKKLLRKDSKLDSIFAVSGTPTFITSDSKEVVGANLNGLRQILGLKPLAVKVKPLIKK